MMNLFDTHCHLNDPAFDVDLDEVMERMTAACVTQAAVVGYDLSSSERAVCLAEKTPGLIAVVGVHPEHADLLSEAALEQLQMLCKHPSVHAVGEIGLDLHDARNPALSIQLEALERQLDLAEQAQLPVCFHVRKAHDDLIRVLQSRKAHLTGGIIHCFSGSWEIARQYLDLGYFLAFGGALTYTGARKAVRVVHEMPMDRILLETDCPYMAPEGHRGERNEPSLIGLVAEMVAQIRGLSVAEVAEITTANARRLFACKDATHPRG